MESGVLVEPKDLFMGPQELLSWTRVCRMSWEGFSQRRQNGLTDEMRLELSAMRDMILHLISEEPVRVEDRAIVYDTSKMEKNKIYPVEVLGRLHLVRKTDENIVETYQLEPIE